MNNEFKFSDFDINFVEPLGKGGFGDVYKATEKNTGKIYAIKRISAEEIKNEEIEEIQNMNLMNKCENSIKYFGYFEYKNLIYLIMELCDYNLEQ